MNNPMIEEIREARSALAAEHGYDLIRINEWARQQTEARQAIQQTGAKALLAIDGANKFSGEQEESSAPHPCKG